MSGIKFNRLTVIKLHGRNKWGTIIWECKCDCGKTVYVDKYSLTHGLTKSCGCLGLENRINAIKTHGDTYTKLYRIWRDMRGRCKYSCVPNYNVYGGKGISVCDEWNDYLKFKDWAMNSGYEETLTIDRIDVDGNYTPENCRWISFKEQQNNKTTNVFLEISGETKTLTEWANIFGVSPDVVNERYHKGRTIEEIFSKERLKPPLATSVLCITTGEIFRSTNEAGKYAGVSNGAIKNCCYGKTNTSGRNPITKERLRWKFIRNK